MSHPHLSATARGKPRLSRLPDCKFPNPLARMVSEKLSGKPELSPSSSGNELPSSAPTTSVAAKWGAVIRHPSTSQPQWCQWRPDEEPKLLPLHNSNEVSFPAHVGCQRRPSRKPGLLPQPGSYKVTFPFPDQYCQRRSAENEDLNKI